MTPDRRNGLLGNIQDGGWDHFSPQPPDYRPSRAGLVPMAAWNVPPRQPGTPPARSGARLRKLTYFRAVPIMWTEQAGKEILFHRVKHVDRNRGGRTRHGTHPG